MKLPVTLCAALALAGSSLGAGVAAYRRSPYVGAIAVAAADGRVLLADNATRPCYPASCTKLMTAYLTLDAIGSGRVRLTDIVRTTAESVLAEPSSTGLRAGDALTVDDLLKAIMVKSANDGAVMLAQHVAAASGGAAEDGKARLARFVAMMNRKAASLGMKNSVYASPNGLPPRRGEKRGFDRSTAADLAVMARHLLSDHPEILKYTSLAGCTVTSANGSRLSYQNHNNFLWKPKVRMNEVDGLKTGYIDAGGSSIVLTASRRGHRAIVVVTGSSTAAERDAQAAKLMNDALGAVDW